MKDNLTGKFVEYREDDGCYTCEVLADTCEPGVDRYKLRIHEVHSQDSFIQRTDSGAWGGMWHVRIVPAPERSVSA